MTDYDRSAVIARGFGDRLPSCRCMAAVEIVAIERAGLAREFRFCCVKCGDIGPLCLPRGMVKPETMADAPVLKVNAGEVLVCAGKARDPLRAIKDQVDRFLAAADPIGVDYEARQAIADGVIDEIDAADRDLVALLKADPHKWGQGLIHLIDVGRDQTLCGKSPLSRDAVLGKSGSDHLQFVPSVARGAGEGRGAAAILRAARPRISAAARGREPPLAGVLRRLSGRPRMAGQAHEGAAPGQGDLRGVRRTLGGPGAPPPVSAGPRARIAGMDRPRNAFRPEGGL
jgi:hypothetical protein